MALDGRTEGWIERQRDGLTWRKLYPLAQLPPLAGDKKFNQGKTGLVTQKKKKKMVVLRYMEF